MIRGDEPDPSPILKMKRPGRRRVKGDGRRRTDWEGQCLAPDCQSMGGPMSLLSDFFLPFFSVFARA